MPVGFGCGKEDCYAFEPAIVLPPIPTPTLRCSDRLEPQRHIAHFQGVTISVPQVAADERLHQGNAVAVVVGSFMLLVVELAIKVVLPGLSEGGAGLSLLPLAASGVYRAFAEGAGWSLCLRSPIRRKGLLAFPLRQVGGLLEGKANGVVLVRVLAILFVLDAGCVGACGCRVAAGSRSAAPTRGLPLWMALLGGLPRAGEVRRG